MTAYLTRERCWAKRYLLRHSMSLLLPLSFDQLSAIESAVRRRMETVSEWAWAWVWVW